MPKPFAFRPQRPWLLSAACVAAATAAWAAAPMDRWEVSTTLNVQGMSLPAVKSTICAERRDDRPPMPADKGHCQIQDTSHVGSTFRWKMVCPEGSGSGEITMQGADAYTGTVTTDMRGQAIVTQLAGRRLGECAADEPSTASRVSGALSALGAQAKAAQAQSAAYLAQACAEAVQEMRPGTLKEPIYACTDDNRAAFCARLKTPDGLGLLLARPRQVGVAGLDDTTEAGKLCGVDLSAQRKAMCAEADAKEDLKTLASACVGEGSAGRKLVLRECVGRGYSSPAAEKFRAFCDAYAAEGLVPAATQAATSAATAGAPAASAAKPGLMDKAQAKKAQVEDALNKGKGLLKGLLN